MGDIDVGGFVVVTDDDKFVGRYESRDAAEVAAHLKARTHHCAVAVYAVVHVALV